jgi:hypothetical protein
MLPSANWQALNGRQADECPIMADYRIYTGGTNGHFAGVEDIECADDQEAVQKAQQVLDGKDIELWERGRFIVRLKSKPK